MKANLDRILDNLQEIYEKRVNRYYRHILNSTEAIHILIFPVNRCNLACIYCAPKGYETTKRKLKIISKEVLDKIIYLIRDFKERNPLAEIKVYFHGYEPLQAGIETFSYVVEKLKNYVDFAVQTNGILINDRWAKFFKENKIKVSLSVDGPEEIQNKLRPLLNGKGSYYLIRRAFNSLRKYGIPIKVISVLTKIHQEYSPERFYDWLREEDIKGINARPVSSSPNTNPYHYKFFPDLDKLADWYIRLYEIWKNETDGRVLHPAELWIQAFIVKEQYKGVCALRGGACYKYFGIDSNGNIHICDRMVMRLGNIEEIHKLEDLIFHPKLKIIYIRPYVVRLKDKECFNCKFWHYCMSGCMYDAMIHGNIFQKSNLCLYYKKVMNYIYEDVRKILRR